MRRPPQVFMAVLAAAMLLMSLVVLCYRFPGTTLSEWAVIVVFATIFGAFGAGAFAVVRAVSSAVRSDLHAARLTRLKKNNCCLKCEYDLTGNISGICPECGTPFEIYASMSPTTLKREIRAVSRTAPGNDLA